MPARAAAGCGGRVVLLAPNHTLLAKASTTGGKSNDMAAEKAVQLVIVDAGQSSTESPLLCSHLQAYSTYGCFISQ